MENTAIVRRVGRHLRPPARCRRSQEKPAKKRPFGRSGNGFLNHVFQPFWAFNGNREVMEREFNNSLLNFSAYYGLHIPDMSALPFPQNIYDSWKEIAGQISKANQNDHCMIMADESRQAVLAVVSTFDLKGCFFYLPVRPFWRWSQSAQHERIAGLLTVIFAYLYQIVGLPFYAEHGTFMDSQYDCLENWLNEAEDEGLDDEEDKAWREHRENTMYGLRQAGIHILRLIQNPQQLAQMEKVVTTYRHRDQHELEWELIGLDFLKLHRDYPGRSLADSIHPDLLYPYEDERIKPTEYTGFYWSGTDCFADEMDELINCTFQEMPVMDEPVSVKCFDRMPPKENNDFDFENRFFPLMERLRNLLDDYDHEEYNGTI